MTLKTFKILFWVGLFSGVWISCHSSQEVKASQNSEPLAFPFKLDDYHLGERIISSHYQGTVYHIYSQRRLFEAFWNQTERLDLAERGELWRDYSFNRIGKKFYTEVIMDVGDRDFEKDYLNMVKGQLAYFAENDHFSRIQSFVIAMENSLEMQLMKTIAHFENFSQEIHVVITFVGPTAAKTYHQDHGKSQKLFILNAENLYKHIQENPSTAFSSLLGE